ncbi:MAG: c-type cytochrome [Steroidobacteraceae bacterium]
MRAILVMAAAIAIAPCTAAPEPTKDELLAELRRQIEGREQEPAEAVFKDIQLFKGRPPDQLLAVMELGFSRSLDVECSHCHDVKDWPGDARKQKAIAREMIQMTREINEKLRTIEGIENDPPVINCTTCHRGQKKPAINLDPPPPK